MTNCLDFGGGLDSFVDSGWLFRILYDYEVAEVLLHLHSAAGSTVQGGSRRSLIASVTVFFLNYFLPSIYGECSCRLAWENYCRAIECRGREGDDWRQINFTSSMTLKFFVQLLFVVLLVRAVDSCGPGRGHGLRRTARRSVYNTRFLSRCLQLQKLANYHAINR